MNGSWTAHPVARLDELLGRPVDLRALALIRVLTGPIVLLHLRPFLERAAGGTTYRDVFHHGYVGWYPELPEPAYVALLVTAAAAAVAMTIGLWTRVATTMVFVVVGYNLFLSTTHLHNNRAYLFAVLGVLAVVPCGRALSIDAWWRRRRGRASHDTVGPGWPLWLLRFECSVVYGASAVSKLVDPDWFGGTVTWGRVVNGESDLRASALPGWLVDLILDRSFHTLVAKLIVLTELFIAGALWWHRTRLVAVWVAVAFHLMIEVSASVEVFSYLAVTVLLAWSVPATRDRTVRLDPANPAHRKMAGGLRALDWLARFRVEPAAPGEPVRVVDRDGTIRSGAGAGLFVAGRLPPTAWFALPVGAAWRRLRARPLPDPVVT